METRSAKLIINKSGGTASEKSKTYRVTIPNSCGTASEKSKTYRVTIPNSWVEQLGISEDNREIELSFDGTEITVRRKQTMQEYKDTHNSNKLLQLQFFHGDSLCTTILADETAEKVLIENHTSDPLYTAFGVNDNPGWQDYQSFLEERCRTKIPVGRTTKVFWRNAVFPNHAPACRNI